MDLLDVNEYLNAASKALQDDPDYQHLLDALYKARKEAIDECGCCTEKVEGCLYQLYAMRLAFILDNRDLIDENIRRKAIPDNVM